MLQLFIFRTSKERNAAERISCANTSPYLTEKCEYALVFLQDLGNGQAATLDPAQWVKEKVTIEGSFPLLCPYVDLLLVVREGAVISVLTVLLVKHIYKATNITPPHMEWRLASETGVGATPHLTFSPPPLPLHLTNI